jgi:S-adenosylmethionine decarboxylase
VHVFYYGNEEPASRRHTTLRVLMHDIDPSVGQCFTHASTGAADVRDMLTGLSLINASMVVDTDFFYPQGYSLIGLIEGGYLTIHVTPEPEASYTSLETNIADPDGFRIIDEITSIFKPVRFCVFLKTAEDNSHGCLDDILPTDIPGFGLEEGGYRRLDRHFKAAFQRYHRNDEFT